MSPIDLILHGQQRVKSYQVKTTRGKGEIKNSDISVLLCFKGLCGRLGIFNIN